ncbi:UPF0175 family protein [Thermococcus alcaliphilus]|uniref:UPF0175 family protein n=1 Tax=Thermococcus alcaliphilus TaxID=139207 RepID=UPI0020903C25|nr:UPF0175 family protein [Thermococcus alcaliphilus]MCO6042167.1 UPF0175 family protein [Thermococcus alcaliphilus]
MMEIRMKLPPFKSEEETKKILRLLYAIELFKEGVVSIEKAAEIAGVSYQDFITELKKWKIPAFPYSDEEALEELGL